MVNLVGKTVQILPYARGVYGRDTLYLVWRMIEDAKAADSLFWGSQDPPEWKGDLTHCVTFFNDPNRYLLMISNLDGSELIGCVWFDDLVPQYRCFGSIFIKPEHRGSRAYEAITLCCQWAFDTLEVKSIWGVTPWKPALHACLQAGFTKEAKLKGFTQLDGEPHDVYIVKKERAHIWVA